MNKLALFILLFSCLSYAQDIAYYNTYSDFENGKNYVMFGDHVAFRAEPDTTSKAMDVLPIGSEIQILEKATQTVLYNGIASHYYKVKYKNQEGYVLGALISLGQIEKGRSKYFYTYSKKDDSFYIVIRHLSEALEINEVTSELETHTFSVELYDNKGLEDVDQIIYINYLAEACGVEGGGIYFFEAHGTMTKAFSISQISDAGVYWFHEELVFPNDTDGIEGKLVYKKEYGTYQDEATNWVEVNTVSRELQWIDGEIVPKLNTEN